MVTVPPPSRIGKSSIGEGGAFYCFMDSESTTRTLLLLIMA